MVLSRPKVKVRPGVKENPVFSFQPAKDATAAKTEVCVGFIGER